MLPYCIKLRFGSCADLRERQAAPLQQHISLIFRLCIKLRFGSCADVRERQGTPLR